MLAPCSSAFFKLMPARLAPVRLAPLRLAPLSGALARLVEQLETAGNAGDGLWRVYLPPIRAGNHHAAVCQTQMEMTAFRPPTSWARLPLSFPPGTSKMDGRQHSSKPHPRFT